MIPDWFEVLLEERAILLVAERERLQPGQLHLHGSPPSCAEPTLLVGKRKGGRLWRVHVGEVLRSLVEDAAHTPTV